MEKKRIRPKYSHDTDPDICPHCLRPGVQSIEGLDELRKQQRRDRLEKTLQYKKEMKQEYTGRKRTVDYSEVYRKRDQGMTIIGIAKEMGVQYTTIANALYVRRHGFARPSDLLPEVEQQQK